MLLHQIDHDTDRIVEDLECERVRHRSTVDIRDTDAFRPQATDAGVLTGRGAFPPSRRRPGARFD
jgi:hypothetical protein